MSRQGGCGPRSGAPAGLLGNACGSCDRRHLRRAGLQQRREQRPAPETDRGLRGSGQGGQLPGVVPLASRLLEAPAPSSLKSDLCLCHHASYFLSDLPDPLIRTHTGDPGLEQLAKVTGRASQISTGPELASLPVPLPGPLASSWLQPAVLLGIRRTDTCACITARMPLGLPQTPQTQAPRWLMMLRPSSLQ